MNLEEAWELATEVPPRPAPLPLPVLPAPPDMPEALCIGEWDLFDPPGSDETIPEIRDRQREAQDRCARCPELSACRAWVESLPANERPVGVVAGEVRNPRDRRKRDRRKK